METEYRVHRTGTLGSKSLWEIRKKATIKKIQNTEFLSNEEKESLTSFNDEDNNQMSGDKTKKIIIQSIDSIFMALNEERTHYLYRIRILLFLSFLINSCFLWMILMMMAPNKNNIYCFDIFSREFKICHQNINYCNFYKNGVRYVAFTDDENISNESPLQELINVNNFYKNFFLRNKSIFSLLNAKIDKHKEIDNYYTVVVVVTTKERFNLINGFYQLCNDLPLTIQVLVLCFLSMAIGNVVYGFLADIMGRKQILIFSFIKQIIGCFIIFLFTAWILSWADNTGNLIVFPKGNDIIELKSDYYIDRFMTKTYYDAYDLDHLNEFHKENFIKFQKYQYEAIRVSQKFVKYKYIFFVGLFLIFSPSSASYNISLSYILENCLNDSMIYNSYIFFHLAIPLSIILQFTLITLCNNFHLPFLILGVILFLICVIFAIIGHESPRHHFEFYEFEEITNFLERIASPEKLDKLYRPAREKQSLRIFKDINRQMREDNKRKFFRICCKEIFFHGYSVRKKQFKRKLNIDDMNGILRTDLLKYPSLILFLISKNKFINKNKLIIVSLVCCIGFIFFLTYHKLNTELLFSRKDLHENFIANMPYFYIVCVMPFSMWIFNLILKFLGFKMILFICFLMTFLFTLIFELISIASRVPNDDNLFEFNSILVMFNLRRGSLIGIFIVIFFFVTALYTYLNIFLIKLSRTLYRCTFLGLIRAIIDFTIFFSFGFIQFFEKEFYYVMIFCVIGFLITYFIKEEYGFTVISDFRKLELAEEE